jgi:protocatechuate 3,4-dioxygenase beta subunit
MRWLSAVVVVLALAGTSAVLVGQDREYIRAMDRAQKERPAQLTSSARIAPETEPGRPLRIRGRLLNLDGSPAADAVVFAYHTDDGGLYDRKGKGPHSWRLRGWVKTDSDGRFTFETIRPGAYPNTNIAPHVHFTAFFGGGDRYHFPDFNLSANPAAGEPEELTVTLKPRPTDKF